MLLESSYPSFCFSFRLFPCSHHRDSFAVLVSPFLLFEILFLRLCNVLILSSKTSSSSSFFLCAFALFPFSLSYSFPLYHFSSHSSSFLSLFRSSSCYQFFFFVSSLFVTSSLISTIFVRPSCFFFSLLAPLLPIPFISSSVSLFSFRFSFLLSAPLPVLLSPSAGRE